MEVMCNRVWCYIQKETNADDKKRIIVVAKGLVIPITLLTENNSGEFEWKFSVNYFNYFKGLSLNTNSTCLIIFTGQ